MTSARMDKDNHNIAQGKVNYLDNQRAMSSNHELNIQHKDFPDVQVNIHIRLWSLMIGIKHLYHIFQI